MKSSANFVAVDLGASSGRLVLGRWDGERFTLEELHRFPNGGVALGGSVYWDVLRLWCEIKAGLAKYAAKSAATPAGISVDTWGVDFGLVDKAGDLLGNPHQYRDPRTDGMPDRVFSMIPASEIFQRTGTQSLQINTLFQLFSMAVGKDPRLQVADALLMMPDLFHFWLSGEKANEYTIASTTQMLDCRERDWARGIMERLCIPTRFLGPIVNPGTVLSQVRPDIVPECGLPDSFPVIAGGSHDTASAVAAVPCLDENCAYISSGTWCLMGVETRQPVMSEQAQALKFTNEGGVDGTIRLLRNITGLWLLQECVRQWQKEGREYGWDKVVSLAAQAEPLRSMVDPDASEFLAPENMPAAIRNFCRRTGQPQSETDGALARCCLESVSLKSRLVLEALETLVNRPLKTIRIVGGGSQNRLLCQFTADCCRRPVIAGPVEAAALGNVMIQAVATGHLDSVKSGRERVAASCDLVTYEPGRADRWDEAYEKFRKLC
jgi:rhamnulokinase